MAVKAPLVVYAGEVKELAAGDTISGAPSGSGSTVAGSATVDFGTAPGSNNAFVVVTGVSSITAGSTVAAFVMADATSDHNADEHGLVPFRLTVGALSAGVGFTIYAVSEWRLTGTFTVRWTAN